MRVGRRRFIEGGLASLACLGLPVALRADTAPQAAFESTTAAEALLNLYGDAPISPSESIALSIPPMVDNGAIVPITVSTTLPGVRSISLLVEENPRPLAAFFELPAGTRPEIGCRIKLAETTPVMAVVQTADGLFSASADVTVTVGGCA